MKKQLSLIALFISSIGLIHATDMTDKLERQITLKSPGNPAIAYPLQAQNGILSSTQNIPVEIKEQQIENDSILKLVITIKAKDLVYYNFEESYNTTMNHDDCQFYMPGFWYRRNLRSPKEAPSFYTSDSWQVREDRLSTPLTGIFNEKTGAYYTVLRLDDFKNESLACHNLGEVILSGKTSLGFTGFRNQEGKSSLVFGFPYSEAPKTYIRKLTLAPAVQAFEKLEKDYTKNRAE